MLFLKNKGALCVLAAAVLWGGIGIFVDNMKRLGVSSLNIVFLRSLFTVLILGVFLAIKSPKDFKISPRDLPLFAGNGLLSVVMFTYCYYKTIMLSTFSVAAVLMYTAPIFVMIISVLFFREKITFRKLLALAVAFTGCAFVSGIVGTAVKISGAALGFGLLTGFGYSLYTIFGSCLILRGYKTFQIIFFTFLFAVVGSAILLAVTGETNPLTYSYEAWIWAFLMAIFNTILPYFFYTYGLKLTDATTAPIIATVEPVAATVVGLFYHQRLTFFGALGIALVLSSVIIINTKDKKCRE